mgnify:CR=1 FL=1
MASNLSIAADGCGTLFQVHAFENGIFPKAPLDYFLPDLRKEGGAYVTVTGKLKKLNRIEKNIQLTDGTVIPVDALLQVDGAIWPDY